MANLSKIERSNLNIAMQRLETFINPTDPACGVSAEAREAAKLYIETWVLSPLREIAAWQDGTADSIHDWGTPFGQTHYRRS